MILFSTPLIIMARQNCDAELHEIAQNLEEGHICQAAKFMDAIAANDTEKVNWLLNKALQSYAGDENTIYGLRKYCEKFDLPITNELADEKDMLLLIAENAAKIDARLNAKGIGG